MLARLLNSFKRGEKEYRFICLGLDNAGKTTILKQLSGEDINQVCPTQGFSITNLVRPSDVKLTAWDVGGHKSMRPYWRNYLTSVDAVVR